MEARHRQYLPACGKARDQTRRDRGKRHKREEQAGRAERHPIEQEIKYAVQKVRPRDQDHARANGGKLDIGGQAGPCRQCRSKTGDEGGYAVLQEQPGAAPAKDTPHPPAEHRVECNDGDHGRLRLAEDDGQSTGPCTGGKRKHPRGRRRQERRLGDACRGGVRLGCTRQHGVKRRHHGRYPAHVHPDRYNFPHIDPGRSPYRHQQFDAVPTYQ